MNYAESKSGTTNLDCSREVGEGFVKFLYSINIEETFLDRNLEILLRLGNKFQIQELKDKVESRMLQLLTKENMVCFLLAGHIYEAGEIKEAAKRMIKTNLDWFEGRPELKEALGDYKDLFLDIFI